jgi:hypothetical protein
MKSWLDGDCPNPFILEASSGEQATTQKGVHKFEFQKGRSIIDRRCPKD